MFWDFIARNTHGLITWGIIWLGAFAHAAGQLQLYRRDEIARFTWVDALILMPLCGFSGMLFGLIASLQFPDGPWIWIMAGVGSFLGIRGVNVIANIILNRLKTKVKENG